MVEAEAFVPRPGSGAIRAVLQLLAGRRNGIVLLGASQDRGQIRIEDICPASLSSGRLLPVPDGLLAAAPRLIEAQGIRLPSAWTELCGSRPLRLAAVPVPERRLHIVMVVTDDALPDLAAMADAADIIAELLQTGQSTQREKDTSRQMAALIDNLPEPLVFVDSRNMRVLLNEQARLLLDLPVGELKEHNVAAALARLVSGSGDDTHKPQLAMEPTARLTFEIRHDTRAFKVETRWIDDIELTGRVWQFSDITLEKAYRANLTDLATLLQLTIENVRDGVALVDADLGLTLWNGLFAGMIAWPGAEIGQGEPLPELVLRAARHGALGNGDPAAIAATVATDLRTETADPCEIGRTDGRLLQIWRKDLGGGRSILVVRDVTDERQAARLKDELVSTVSHELRTPITSILGALQLVKGGVTGPLSPETLGLVTIAEKNSDRLNRLVNDLLDLDKLQNGMMELHRAPVELREFLADAAEQNAPYTQSFGVAIVLDTGTTPITLDLDRFRMLQVMSNLISNAAKFSPAGEDITLRLRALPDRVRISVIDRGRGISPEFRERLFVRFSQEALLLPNRPAGTGLGLAITRSIVEQHGGRIALDPATRIGATFHIDLPGGDGSG